MCRTVTVDFKTISIGSKEVALFSGVISYEELAGDTELQAKLGYTRVNNAVELTSHIEAYASGAKYIGGFIYANLARLTNGRWPAIVPKAYAANIEYNWFPMFVKIDYVRGVYHNRPFVSPFDWFEDTARVSPLTYHYIDDMADGWHHNRHWDGYTHCHSIEELIERLDVESLNDSADGGAGRLTSFIDRHEIMVTFGHRPFIVPYFGDAARSKASWFPAFVAVDEFRKFFSFTSRLELGNAEKGKRENNERILRASVACDNRCSYTYYESLDALVSSVWSSVIHKDERDYVAETIIGLVDSINHYKYYAREHSAPRVIITGEVEGVLVDVESLKRILSHISVILARCGLK